MQSATVSLNILHQRKVARFANDFWPKKVTVGRLYKANVGVSFLSPFNSDKTHPYVQIDFELLCNPFVFAPIAQIWIAKYKNRF